MQCISNQHIDQNEKLPISEDTFEASYGIKCTCIRSAFSLHIKLRIVLRSTCKRIFLQPVKLYIDLFAVKLIYCILIMAQIKNQTNLKSRACCNNQSMLWFPSARFLRFYWYIGWLRCNISNNFVQVINQYLIFLKRLLLLFLPPSCIGI